MSLKLNSSGGGSVTLQEPVTASDLTVNLPATLGNTGNSMAVTSDASGNVGVGVTPSAWNSVFKVLQISQGAFGSQTNAQVAHMWSNAIFDSVGYKYIASSPATHYRQFNGAHEWYNAPSGTAGNAISFTQAMTLDASGGLILAGSTAQKATGTTWSNPSDQRLKDNIRDYNKGVTELMQVRVCEWEYNGKGGTVQGTKGLGVVADEVMAVLPDTVSTYDAKLNIDDEEVTAIKKFDATEITWLLVKTVQELKAELDTVKAELAVLKGTA